VELQRPLNTPLLSPLRHGERKTNRQYDTPPPLPFRERGANLEALLDNVRSAWNVGAIFRTADAFGVRRLHLYGITPTPENASVAKTALGADKTVGWTASRNGLTAARELKANGAQLWALEQDERAISIYDLVIDDLRLGDMVPELGHLVIGDSPSSNHPITYSPNHPITLIVGNEITGVDPALLDLCDKILYIPMRGEKRSLNVEVAFGVAVNQIVEKMGL
jgi:tRNA G18 (ribose-2'-O)-methylase SpoU